ncbi:NAD-dependent epimerase/dehydratase family protein [Paenibacillus thalictri]|nr:NAD-dependent epimerase/dehydratase family protein [Paenibacillus thalictri]
MSKVFLIGGPGNISRGTIDYLLERNSDIAVFTRNTAEKHVRQPNIHYYEGSRNDADSLGRALRDFGAQLVIDTICFTLREAEQLYEITRGRIAHLLFISTVDIYGYPLSRLPYRESDDRRPPHGEYANNKWQVEQFYMDKYTTEVFPVTIGRPSLSIGPHFCPMLFRDWGKFAVPRMKANRPILVPGDGNGLMHVGWGYDVGRMAGRIIGDRAAIGKDYTLSTPQCIARDDYISLFTRELKVDPERVYIPSHYIETFAGVNALSPIPHLYRHHMAFSLDKFKHDFPDYEWLPLLHGVKEFIVENEARSAFPDLQIEIIEDRIIAEWKKRLAGW